MTSRQFYITFWIIVVSLKVQKMPSVMYEFLNKDFYLMLVPFFAINLLGIFMAFYILKKTKQQSLESVNQENQNGFWVFFQKGLVLAISIYFLAQALLLYESTRNLFEHILFDNLSWAVFSTLLLAAVFYLAHTGISNIALNMELYFYIIVISYVVIAAFGASKADFTFLFPLETIKIKPILDNFLTFNIWFGDFFLVLFLGKHSKEIKLKWTVLTYVLAIGIIALLYLEFGGIYGDYAVMKPSLISTITEQSMLDLNIGRIDWFLILFAEIGTILSCGICVYFSSKCMQFVFPKIKRVIILSVISVALYSINVFYLVDTHRRVLLFMKYLTVVAALTKWIPFVIMFFICLFMKKEYDKTSKARFEKNKQVSSRIQSKKAVKSYET